ncbi:MULTISPECIES: GGDEF and EAL domain-containing protein [unclassified Clostridioides]|uniref:bifunctional diguanylate cyclase/phosphodiesterase n=1 Tax=unclassified Clostridioides TaxID=2635829 RepID=UPI001D1051EE|nr:GGDEF and EAL domain-containing protein [Clostridioides sp. ZZV14-6150]MCC0661460.1 GGDEF and EAL domain-containing protein [Clostridioides sp. ZZV14-6154]MCC0668660.1 GGDEF and EAL domain-containing protein [Clostridioides sp. ZZV14-6153]MCC0722000.1 GGDEF and EAL domain-containing protein [Clostridioides sp. ZZV14-6104]MCC0732047.1 GGDEF and EAL domain-containing protein [Clostridioides sp. ZZV14-6048]MCC0743699.1 GGDEF and EAL domain-containing protein [Clostridioides sp. ZZV14-6044]MCC
MREESNSLNLDHIEIFFELLSQSTEDYIFFWDINRNKFKISSAIFDEFNLSKDMDSDVVNCWSKIVYPDDVKVWKDDIQALVDGKKDEHNLEYRLINKYEEVVWISCRGKAYVSDDQKTIIIVGRIKNIGEKNKFDSITGTWNREQFEYRMNCIIKEKIYTSGAIFIMDIDNFKNINEKYGHSYGDKVLRAIATEVLEYLPKDVRLYRLDGDEFAFFYPMCNKETIENLYEKIQLYTNTQHEIESNKYYCTVTAGVAMYPEDGDNYLDLFKHADIALDIAKMGGKNRMKFFSKELYENKLKVISMQQKLRECIENDFNDLELFFQPQVDASTKNVIGAEALLRWHSNTYGEVSPVEFIPILEQSNLIIPVGKWIIKEAVKQCKEWHKVNPAFKISVNVSYIQLKEDFFRDFIIECLIEYQLKPEFLILELTENCWIPDINLLNDKFISLKSIGVHIAIDDFGTGYSSLNYLKELSVNIIKIERSFVKNITYNSYEHTFLEYIIKLAHIINLKVCVEGIESYEEYNIVKSLGVDIIQGFLFGRPVSASEFYRLKLSN